MDALEKRKHHIVVIDMRLPVYSAGEQICKKIRSVCGLQNIVLLAVSPAMLVEIEREHQQDTVCVMERERGEGSRSVKEYNLVYCRPRWCEELSVTPYLEMGFNRVRSLLCCLIY